MRILGKVDGVLDAEDRAMFGFLGGFTGTLSAPAAPPAEPISSIISEPVSEIMQRYLHEQDDVSFPFELGSWPCFTASLPDSDELDNVLCLYDDYLEKDGRIMSTGEVIVHYGLVIRLRSDTHPKGWLKANQIAERLDQIYNETITLGSATYFLIHNATRRTGVNSLGLESGTKRRFLFDTRYVITVSEI